jgi:hypothetical protein
VVLLSKQQNIDTEVGAFFPMLMYKISLTQSLLLTVEQCQMEHEHFEI